MYLKSVVRNGFVNADSVSARYFVSFILKILTKTKKNVGKIIIAAGAKTGTRKKRD